MPLLSLFVFIGHSFLPMFSRESLPAVKRQTIRILAALVLYAAATAISISILRNEIIGLVVDGVLLLAFFYYLATLR